MFLNNIFASKLSGRWLLPLALLITTLLYWPGLWGDFLFDDYPNIVDNPDLHPRSASFAALLNAALSSPASDLKRPLASLSFAVNYLLSGLDPFWMKLTNLAIHLTNGWLIYLLACLLLRASNRERFGMTTLKPGGAGSKPGSRYTTAVAAATSATWMVLPINLTAVLYTVQRMESMANLFVLLGLIGYTAHRSRMLGSGNQTPPTSSLIRRVYWQGLTLSAASITLPVLLGILAKETVVMLPLYAFLIEWALFGFRTSKQTFDKALLMLFFLALFLPFFAGCVWLLPHVLNPGYWQTRNFTLATRLLSESRVVIDYLAWTLLPTPHALSFYHDNFPVSSNLFSPWTTLACLLLIAGLVAGIFWLRPRAPLVALGLALFLGAQLLTGTIIPLELVYEHRNYFASFGVLLAVVPLLAVPKNEYLALPRLALLIGLTLYWCFLTGLTAFSWGNPVRLAEELASRAPDSPRAEYELGRTYIIYSHYDPTSPFTRLAYAPLERAAQLPGSSILPEQALIFMNARMHLPLKEEWWQSMIIKLKAHPVGVQDESSLGTLTQCMRDGACELPVGKMTEVYLAAVINHKPSARLLAMYADFAWNVLGDRALALRMAYQSAMEAPNEPAYHITLARMLIASGQPDEANQQIEALQRLNLGGRLNESIQALKQLQRQSPE